MGSLTVHVLDDDGHPVSGKRVGCHFPGFGPTHTEEYTDDNGVAEFDDVPVCTVEVYVNGDLQVEIGVGSGDHEDVTVTL
jgi:hypothetical protein